MLKQETFFLLDPKHTDRANIKKEREKAKKLKKTTWWLTRLQLGLCYYCQNKFPSHELTMDHIVPIARGGRSSKGNIVTSCLNCNRGKKLKIPAEAYL
ncbi:MAG: HNH endonuclease [Deltaproteobacteria bacterium]|nr:HNH endonuclease [Deltaproteobacteria bacterium]